MNVSKVKLNILIAFDELLLERNVTKAAKKLNITQAAMSNCLTQIRQLFKDEILIRSGKQMLPTIKASALHQKIHPLIQEIKKAVIGIEEFEPKTSQRTFNIGTYDYVEYLMLPKICEQLSQKAPDVKLRIKHVSLFDGDEIFENSDIELGIGVLKEKIAGQLCHQLLFKDIAVCAGNKKHPLMQKRMTLDDFLEAKHLSLAPEGNPLYARADQALKKLGVKRNIVLSSPSSLTVPRILINTPLLLVLPKRLFFRLAAHTKNLVAQELPIKIEPLIIYQIWHKTYATDNGHKWLRNLVKTVADLICATETFNEEKLLVHDENK